VRLRISDPSRSFEAAPKALVGVGLNLGNARVDLAIGAFALDIAAAIIAIELEHEPVAAAFPLKPRLSQDGSSGQNKNDASQTDGRGEHLRVPLS
jgi:hypothetical protein